VATRISEVAVVGAGPYGLSAAAHLSAKGPTPAVFGGSMETWREGMPRGMRLKSEGFASNLSEPSGGFTLKAFCEAEGRPYADANRPIEVDTFVAYGDAFQRRFVPQLDIRRVTHIGSAPGGFALELDDGEAVVARKVVVATGLRAFRQIPAALAGLSSRRVSHSGDRSDYSGFAGARVMVVGAGASATDVAAELAREGAEVTLVCRAPELRFFPGGFERRRLDAMISPMTPVGPGWKKWIVVTFPGHFHRLPESLRVWAVENSLGPAPGWFIRAEIEGKVAILSGSTIVSAREAAGAVDVEIASANGARQTLQVDHVFAGTGYRVDVDRLAFLDPDLARSLRRVEGAPKLSANFESSVPGLYFVGAAAAYEFGPVSRFVCGADFAARRVAASIASALGARARASGERPAAVLANS
jgi:thioredoxin reductase